MHPLGVGFSSAKVDIHFKARALVELGYLAVLHGHLGRLLEGVKVMAGFSRERLQVNFALGSIGEAVVFSGLF